MNLFNKNAFQMFIRFSLITYISYPLDPWRHALQSPRVLSPCFGGCTRVDKPQWRLQATLYLPCTLSLVVTFSCHSVANNEKGDGRLVLQVHKCTRVASQGCEAFWLTHKKPTPSGEHSRRGETWRDGASETCTRTLSSSSSLAVPRQECTDAKKKVKSAAGKYKTLIDCA